MTLIDAPKSTLDFSNLVLLIVDGMETFWIVKSWKKLCL